MSYKSILAYIKVRFFFLQVLLVLTFVSPVYAGVLPPSFTKQFSPATIELGGTSTLTFTIDNTASGVDATSLDFTDSLPAGVVVATPANASNTCTGGTLTAAQGTGIITYTGGAVSAWATCTITVDVTGNTAGIHVNTTGDLTSSSGNSGPASDTLTVNPAADLSVSKTDDTDPIVAGNNLTYTVTITNNGPDDAANVVVTDTLPAGVTLVSTSGCTEDPAGVPTCSLGTIASGGSAVVTIEVTVDAATRGTITNQVSVTSITTDPDAGNNSVSEDTSVIAAPTVTTNAASSVRSR